jgi:hypothetical protein
MLLKVIGVLVLRFCANIAAFIVMDSGHFDRVKAVIAWFSPI